MRVLFAAILAVSAWANPASAQNVTDQVRQLLKLTSDSWITVREFDGQDLLYFTHLLIYRCVLKEIRYGLNGAEASQVFEAEPCPSGMLGQMIAPIEAEGHLPYLTFDLKSIDSVIVSISYDDGGVQTQQFQRANVMTP